jgi:predicted RNA-binding Zn-ribbon protein involved in translation (DUF1610 family)
MLTESQQSPVQSNMLPLYDRIPARCPKCNAKLVPGLSLCKWYTSEPHCLFCGYVFLLDRTPRYSPRPPKKDPKPARSYALAPAPGMRLCVECGKEYKSYQAYHRCPSCVDKARRRRAAQKAQILAVKAAHPQWSLLKISCEIGCAPCTVSRVIHGRVK